MIILLKQVMHGRKTTIFILPAPVISSSKFPQWNSLLPELRSFKYRTMCAVCVCDCVCLCVRVCLLCVHLPTVWSVNNYITLWLSVLHYRKKKQLKCFCIRFFLPLSFVSFHQKAFSLYPLLIQQPYRDSKITKPTPKQNK